MKGIEESARGREICVGGREKVSRISVHRQNII